jgi:hypothetical protein
MSGLHAGGLTFARYWGEPRDGKKTRWASVSDGPRHAADIHVHPTPRRTFVLAGGGTANGRTLRDALAETIKRAQTTVDTLEAIRRRTITDPPPSPWALVRQARDLGLCREEIGEILVGCLDHVEAGQGWDTLGAWLEEAVAEARSDAEDARREARDQARDTAGEAAAWARGGR